MSKNLWYDYSKIFQNWSDTYTTVYIHYQMMKNNLTVTEVVNNESNEVIKNNLSDFINSDKNKINDLDKGFINARNKFTATNLEDALLEVDSSYFGRKDSKTSMIDRSLRKLVVSLSGEVRNKRFADFCSTDGNNLYQYGESGAKELIGIDADKDVYFMLNVTSKILKERYPEIKINLYCESIFEFSQKNLDKKYDLIVSEFPWNIKLPKESIGKQWNSKLFDDKLSERTSSDWRHISVVMHHLSEEGKGFVLAPTGIEFRSIDDELRSFFIQKGFLEKVILLPENLLKGTGLPSYLLVLSHGNNKIQFVDASNIYSEKGRERFLSDENIDEILNKVTDNATYISKEKVLENERLNPAFYSLPALKSSTKLSYLADIKRGTQFKRNELSPYLSETRTNIELIRTRHLKDGMVIGSDSLSKLPNNYTGLKNQDLLITRVGSNLEVAIHHSTNGIKTIIDESLYVIRCDQNKINPYYLLAFLQSSLGKEYLSANYRGGIISQISISVLNDLDLPLLSKVEQENISKQFESINQEINNYRVKMETLKDQKKDKLNSWFKGAIVNE